MEWIEVIDQNDVPHDKTIIVEDCNGWMGQAFWDGTNWVLETFGHTKNIIFDAIVRYLIISD